jgi:hypothetical protein
MADRRRRRGAAAGSRTLALLAFAALLAATASYAADASPFMTITRWQQGKLGGTEFSTHAIKKVGEQYFLLRRIKEGELFPRVVDRYCAAAGINADGCKEVTRLAEEHHTQEHWHKNWQPNDAAFLQIPKEVYEAATPAK